MSKQCPVCRENADDHKAITSRTGEIINIYTCSNCTHVFQADIENVDIYSSGEFSILARNNTNIPSPEKIKSLDKNALRRFNFYKKYFDGVRSSLEIGSSIGSFVSLLKLSGVDASGIEPDADYAKFAESQYGFTQEATLYENFKTDKKFDLAYSFHVIEHVNDPLEYATKTISLLNTSGKILIECPSWDTHSFGDINFTVWKPHIHYFTFSSLYYLLAKNGFKVKEINLTGSAIYAVAEKSDQENFNKSEFNKYLKKHKRVFRLNRAVPKLPLNIKGTNLKQLVLQYALGKNNTRSTKELLGFSKFYLKNLSYLKKERGSAKPKACHVSYFSGWENAGDTVLSACVRKAFNTTRSNGWDLLNLSGTVNEQTLARINKSKYLVIGGGGVLLPDSNPNTKSGWQWAIEPEMWDQINVPVIVYAIGYNFFKGQKNSALFVKNLEHLVKRADFFSLRNWGSINKVKEILPEELHPKIFYQPCPTTVIRQLYPEIGPKRKTKTIGVNIAYDRYERRFGANMYEILDQIALALKEIEGMGYRIINTCHLETDKKFEISLDKRRVNYETVNLQFMLPNKVYDFYNNMEVIFGMRGHAQMIPFGLNGKIISLVSHDKLRYFLEDIHAPEWGVDLHQNPANISIDILDKFTSMTSVNPELVDQKLISEQEKLFKVTSQNLGIISEILE